MHHLSEPPRSGHDGPTQPACRPREPPIATTVLIVDDQAPFRTVARTVVSLTPGFEVAGEAGTGEEAVALAAELHPDLILMDINLPGINGVEATRRIRTERPEAQVILLSTYSVEDLPADAASVGATYVHKEDFSSAVLTAQMT